MKKIYMTIKVRAQKVSCKALVSLWKKSHVSSVIESTSFYYKLFILH